MISLPLALGLTIGLVVALSVGVVLAIGFQAGTRNTFALLAQSATQSLDLLEQELRDHLEPSRETVASMARLVASGQLNPDEGEQFRLALLGAAGASTASAVLLVRPDGRMEGFWRDPGNDGLAYFTVGADGQSLDALALDAARSDDAAYWTQPVFTSSDSTALTVRQRLVRDGHRYGVLIATVSLKELSGLASMLHEPESEQKAFILLGRNVLAHPALAAGFPGLSIEHPLPTIDEIGDPVLLAMGRGTAYNPLKAYHVDTEILTSVEPAEVLLRRQIPLGGADVTIGFYRPIAEVDAELTRLYHAALAGLIVLVVAVLGAFVVGHFMARPVAGSAAIARHVADFELDRVPELGRSRIRELDDHARAFNAMLRTLRWFETYVPKSLVRRLMASADRPDLVFYERDVTIMFTDLVDFTGLAEGLTPPETARLINDHFAIVTACIEAEGGTVDKFIGDAVMAFWNAPDEQKDHVDRACRAAVAIRDAVMEVNQANPDRRVRMRIGLHCGPVVVGNIGSASRMNYTVIGDAVNVAQRLEALGKELEPHDEAVIVLASGDVICRATAISGVSTLGARLVKGKLRPIEVMAFHASARLTPLRDIRHLSS